MVDLGVLWLEVLTAVVAVLIAVLGWIFRSFNQRLEDTQILLRQTREEMGRTYVTKADVKDDFDRLFARLDAIELKLDRYVERGHAQKG